MAKSSAAKIASRPPTGKGRRARLQHDQNTGEAHDRGDPAARADPFAQHQDGDRDHPERDREVQRDGFRERRNLQRRVPGPHGEDADSGTHGEEAEAAQVERPEADPET